MPITSIHFARRFQFSGGGRISPSRFPLNPSARMKEVYVWNRDRGQRCAANGGREEGAERNREARGAWTSIIIRWTLRRLEHASIIWWIEEGRTFPLASPPLRRASTMLNDQLHHTSHSRYIRRHNVGVRSQHAPSFSALRSAHPPLPLLLFSTALFSYVYLFGSLRKESFNCQRSECGREKRKGRKFTYRESQLEQDLFAGIIQRKCSDTFKYDQEIERERKKETGGKKRPS